MDVTKSYHQDPKLIRMPRHFHAEGIDNTPGFVTA